MPDNPAVPAGMKLNELAKFDVGVGVVLLTLRDAGKDARKVTYSELYEAVQSSLTRRLERYQIAEPERIVTALLEYLRDRQSVFTLSAH